MRDPHRKPPLSAAELAFVDALAAGVAASVLADIKALAPIRPDPDPKNGTAPPAFAGKAGNGAADETCERYP